MGNRKILQKLGLLIRKTREQKGISLNRFAIDNNMTKSGLSKIENGLSNPQILTIVKIAKGLDISLAKLLSDFD